jgi:hypothetical protein
MLSCQGMQSETRHCTIYPARVMGTGEGCHRALWSICRSHSHGRANLVPQRSGVAGHVYQGWVEKDWHHRCNARTARDLTLLSAPSPVYLPPRPKRGCHATSNPLGTLLGYRPNQVIWVNDHGSGIIMDGTVVQNQVGCVGFRGPARCSTLATGKKGFWRGTKTKILHVA